MNNHHPGVFRSAAAAREEVLEELWTSAEGGRLLTVSSLTRTIHAGPSDGWGGTIQELVERGLVGVTGQELALTPAGEVQAREVVRRHRLAEVLFHQVFELPMHTTEQQACTIEHVLTEQVTEAVCSFLGHPPVCPHGRPIPPGRCCSTLSRRVDPLITRLLDQQPGDRGRVVLVAPRHRDRFEQLSDLGVIPGAILTVRQRQPSMVVVVDNTLLALEDELAAGIYVRPLMEW
jgi:DtxR family Mn-dependent transcriptional regulator